MNTVHWKGSHFPYVTVAPNIHWCSLPLSQEAISERWGNLSLIWGVKGPDVCYWWESWSLVTSVFSTRGADSVTMELTPGRCGIHCALSPQVPFPFPCPSAPGLLLLHSLSETCFRKVFCLSGQRTGSACKCSSCRDNPYLMTGR